MSLLMVATAFAIIGFSAQRSGDMPSAGNDASVATVGPREVTYTISNMGESYIKDSSASALGRHGSTPGLNQWWTERKLFYSDAIVHNSFPYSIATNMESSYNSYSGVPHIPYGQYGFYRFSVDAANIQTLATGPGKDPLIFPVLGPGLSDGGTVSFNWYFTYLTSMDITSILAGTHYANTHYGVSPMDVVFGGAYANDGWYVELQGITTFDRLGAKKFLGLPATGDLRTEFNAANAYDDINKAWSVNYLSDGSYDGPYDIFAGYDYSIESGPVLYFLSVDPTSSADSLKLRMWGYSWGMEVLMLRYLDVLGVLPNFQPWMEDWYFNGTITSDHADIQSRAVAVYNMYAWKDPQVWTGAWVIEPIHIDYNDFDWIWKSRFTPYVAYRGHTPLKTQWVPGTNNIGSDVAFWYTPECWNLVQGEKLVVKLSDRPYLGYEPYKGTVSDIFPKQGGGNDAKVAELNKHKVWGELVLGHGYPAGLYSATYYDHASKTLIITGPTSFPRNPDTVFASLNETGSPLIMLDIARVSRYDLSPIQPGPYVPGVDYVVQVAAKNISNSLVTDWNGTVDLAGANAILGSTTHTFAPTDQGVWYTTFRLAAEGDFGISATDRVFPLDVVGLMGTNTPPTARIVVTPSSGDTSTVFTADASSSTDFEDPVASLQVRWDWESDGTYDTDWSFGKTAEHQYLTAGQHYLRAEVRDTGGLTSTASMMIAVAAPNLPPVAEFVVTPATGDTNVVFSFDASLCADAEDPASALEVRWDWTSDGVYDTDWTTVKQATNQFAVPGDHSVTLEVRDTQGATDTSTQSVLVVPPVPPPITVLKTSKQGSNPVVWTYQPVASGNYSVTVENHGLKTMVFEVYDITDGSSTKILRQTIKFTNYGAYPSGTMTTDECQLLEGHVYKIVAKDFDGPVGSWAVLVSNFAWHP
jgi:hypothetical protein